MKHLVIVSKRGQLDVYVRFWNDSNYQVSNRYLNSEFLGKASAVDVYGKLNACCPAFDKNKVIQVGFTLVCCFNTL